MSLRESIFAIDDRRATPVVVPEWNGLKVYVRAMNVPRQRAYNAAAEQYPKAAAVTMLVVFTAEDDAGNLIFTPEDIPALEERNMAPLRRLRVVAEALEPTVESLRKNLSAPPSI